MSDDKSAHPFGSATPAVVAATFRARYGEHAITGARAAQRMAEETQAQLMIEHWAEVCAILEEQGSKEPPAD